MAEREGFEPLRPDNLKASLNVLLSCYEELRTGNKIERVITNSIQNHSADKSMANIFARNLINSNIVQAIGSFHTGFESPCGKGTDVGVKAK